MVELTREDLGIDLDAEWHDFMIAPQGNEHDPVEVLKELQEKVGDLGKTKATFRPTDYFDWACHPNIVPDRMVELTGAWPVPEPYRNSEQFGRHFVNPNYIHARHFAEVVVRCKCGALLMRYEKVNGNPATQGEHEHTDDCLRQWRFRARARLAEKRRRIAIRGMHLGHTVRQMQDRLGLASDYLEGAESIGVDIEKEKKEGRRVRARTWARMAMHRKPEEIAEAYGCCKAVVLRYIRRHTETTPRELMHHRRSVQP